MKKRIQATIVVEGKTDIAFLESFIEAEFVSTNGSDVPRETIAYLKTLSAVRPIVVLTDPDGPGARIRKILDDEITNLHHAFVKKTQATKNGKVGIAESYQEAVLQALDLTIKTNEISPGELDSNDLYELGLLGTSMAKHRREKISETFHLGYVNGKQLLFRLNNLNIPYGRIKEALDGK